jgi:hypothetical protein
MKWFCVGALVASVLSLLGHRRAAFWAAAAGLAAMLLSVAGD